MNHSTPNPRPRPRETRTKGKKELRRRLVPVQPGLGLQGATLKSLTLDDGTKYHPMVCLETGQVRCDCDDFFYRRARHEPTLDTPQHFCKHLRRYVDNENRKGTLPPTRPCSICGVADAEWKRAESHAQGLFICASCVSAARALPATLALETREQAEMQGRADIRAFLDRHTTPVGLCPCCGEPESFCHASVVCRNLLMHDAFLFTLSTDPELDEQKQRDRWNAEMTRREEEREDHVLEEVNLMALRAGFSYAEVFGAAPVPPSLQPYDQGWDEMDGDL